MKNLKLKMENCGREDGLQYKKHIMPERELLNVKLKIENGKLMSGRQFAK